MKNTTLCYIEDNRGRFLMLHRTKKQNDENFDKWIGVGGKFEEGESPYDCVQREMREETGLVATNLAYRGIVTFVSNCYPTEQMHLFECKDYTGTLKKDCCEGDLVWVPKEQIDQLNLWEGDKLFLQKIAAPCPFFSLKLVYVEDQLVKAVWNGKEQ